MPALPNGVLRSKLAGALPEGTRFYTGPEDIHPALASVPGVGRVRFYLWTVTPDRSAKGARGAGENKIQLILPGQKKRTKASLETQGAYTVLLGYSAEFGVFVAWEAPLYQQFAYSRNVQCREELLREARGTGWAVAPPHRAGGSEEVRVGFSPGNVLHFVRTSRAADERDLRGQWREAHFLAQTPNAKAPLPTRAKDLEEYVEKQRERVAVTRLVRYGKFSALVKKEYDYACAVCTLHLEITEGAHIIPVRENGSSDKVWNGIALCPNHHELFDGTAFVVNPELQVRVDRARVDYLRENDLAQGIEILTDFDGETIRPPRFWESNAEYRERMIRALSHRAAAAGIA